MGLNWPPNKRSFLDKEIFLLFADYITKILKANIKLQEIIKYQKSRVLRLEPMTPLPRDPRWETIFCPLLSSGCEGWENSEENRFHLFYLRVRPTHP